MTNFKPCGDVIPHRTRPQVADRGVEGHGPGSLRETAVNVTHNHLVKPQGGLGSRTYWLGGLHARGYTHPLLCGFPSQAAREPEGGWDFWENDMSPDQGTCRVLPYNE
ncbi:hypothetical protein EVAR_91127_1 [Eumeta japonica]|uniref:Uncharacterized protein n=1 Tax=Eumeta variegata TaxID=151549 RepID=A0A4C1SG57_EUMVA|nr:hypothetical protein EVAR_91127_1 [Eumeta japonica]